MTKLETIKKQIETEEQQQAQREQERAALRAQIADMEKQINTAIDRNDTGTAEKLLIRQNELKTKLTISERIQARRFAPDRYFEDCCAAGAEKAAELQPKADKAADDLLKAHKVYMNKVLDLVNILHEAVTYRMECGTYSGIGPLSGNERYAAVPGVKHDNSLLIFSNKERRILCEMDPDIFIKINDIQNYGVFK